MLFRFRVLALLALTATLSACFPSDPTTVEGADIMPSQMVDRLPDSLRAPDNSFTGVIVYGDKGYTGVVGSSAYPGIRVNDRPVGKCAKRRAFMIALAPGTYQLSAHSENKVIHNVTLSQGQVAYFRCSYLRIGGILLPPAVLDTATPQEAFDTVNN